MKRNFLSRKLKERTLLFSILLISIGFAVLTSNLNINGVASVEKAKWSVYFDNLSLDENNTISASVAEINEEKDQVNYNISLEKPGDSFSFDVDIVNDGTIDAMIESYSVFGIPEKYKTAIIYSVTYQNGAEFNVEDFLSHDSRETISVKVEYSKNIDSTNLIDQDENLNLTFSISYVQDSSNSVKGSLIQHLSEKAVRDDQASEFVSAETGINFLSSASDTNGKGLYLFSSTADDKFPIYYYRGDVDDNNLIYASKCWKIVRTTETGGTKIIYSGPVNADGDCVNVNETAIKNIKYNESSDSPVDSGYMFGERYPTIAYKDVVNQSEVWYYGNDVTYDKKTGMYTLVDTIESSSWADDFETIGNAHHYTCFSNSKTCENVYFISCSREAAQALVQLLTDGDMIEDRLYNMFRKSSAEVNKYPSTIKTEIDNWYLANIPTEDRKLLEDTVWCDDRTISNTKAWSKDNINTNPASNYILPFDAETRYNKGEIKLTCDAIQDKFTVSKSKGNGALDYPVATLNLDEVNLAGKRNAKNPNYLDGNPWFIMTSLHFGSADSRAMIYNGNGLYDYISGSKANARPAVSLRRGTKIISGNGSEEKPYIIK